VTLEVVAWPAFSTSRALFVVCICRENVTRDDITKIVPPGFYVIYYIFDLVVAYHCCSDQMRYLRSALLSLDPVFMLFFEYSVLLTNKFGLQGAV
jgi:hypothetical protein